MCDMNEKLVYAYLYTNRCMDRNLLRKKYKAFLINDNVTEKNNVEKKILYKFINCTIFLPHKKDNGKKHGAL